MSACSPADEVKHLNQQSVSPADENISKSSEQPLQHEDDEERNRQGDDNVHRNTDESGDGDEDEEEEEDLDFNPFLRETHSVQSSSSLSSEVEGLDVDVADSGRNTSAASLKNSKTNHANSVQNYPIGDTEYGEEIVMQTAVSSGEALGKKSDLTSATITERELVFISQSDNGLPCDKKNGLCSRADGSNPADSRKLIMGVDPEDAICMRTRARYSLASFTLDELETFLQETDDEDDLQNVDDEREYRKFLAAVLLGVDDSQNLKGIENVDDEDEENDADFELELEEALESEPNEIEEQLKTRLRQKASLDHSKVSGQSNRPLRPLLPFSSIGSFPTHDGKLLLPNISPPYKPPVNNGLVNGFTPHQIGQLHCLIHEHVQLLIQIFSICALKPGKGHIATELQKLILDMLHKCDEVLAWRRIPYPSFCFFPPYIHPSLQDELPKILPPQCNKEMPDTCDIQQQDRLFTSNTALHSDTNSPSKERDKHLPSKHAICFQTRECTSWVPYISGPVLSVLDVAPLRLVGNYIDDISSAVRAYERCQIGVGFDTQFEREPLFPLCNFPCSSESDGHGLSLSSPASKKIPKKTMAATLIEKAKNQTVALVPKEIAKLAQRFCPLFNPVLYPYKPPPASLTSRVFFTDSEDELLALGLMEYNTDWKAIQQRFLPCKSKHQIFIRQKNRASSKAPENPIKAVRRIKNSPLTSDEIARIEVGLKKFKLDWISIWRFLVPYRDPSLLPRLWRIAFGTQKSYKSDANKKAKRRLYESKRRASKPSVSIRHSSSEKEGGSTDNAIEEGNKVDNCMDWEDEAYVHEAFLADWRPDNSNISLKCSTRVPSLESSQVREGMDNSGGGDINTQSCTKFSSASRFSGSQVVLRPYRARRANNARLVKLAPDLPPVNLPPSVRIMSQSAFKCSQGGASTKISCTDSGIGVTVAENTALQVVCATKSGIDSTVKPGHIRSVSMKNTISNQHQILENSRNKCSTEERGDPDLQMHPLLFQTPEDGALQYYPLNSSTSTFSSFSLFSGNQPQLNLGLFHNPRHIRDAVNFLSKSSKPLENKSSSSGMDFHPLLQRANDLDSDMLDAHSAAKLPSKADTRQKDGSLSASCSKLPCPSGKANGLDLDIHLSFTSRNNKSIENRNMTENCIDKLVNAAVSGSIDSESAKDSSKQRDPTPEGISDKLDSGDHVLDTRRNERSEKIVDDMGEESLPEIVMEHEELSDSEDEFGENVEFEREEMTDSEGGDTSDSEQFVDISNEEVHQDITDADADDQNVLNTNGDPGGSICRRLDGGSTELGLAERRANIESSALHLNLNSWPPVSPIADPKKAKTMYNFGPFGENQVPASKRCVKLEISHTGAEKLSKDLQHQSMDSDNDPVLRKPSKRVCRTDSSLSAGSEKGTSIVNIDRSVENPKNGTVDEFR